MGGSRDAAMSEYIKEWQRHLGAPGQSRLGRVITSLRESRTSGSIMLIVTFLAVVDTLRESSSRPLNERVSMRTLCGGFSSFVAYIIMSRRKQHMWDALDHAGLAAAELESGASEAGRVGAETPRLRHRQCSTAPSLATLSFTFESVQVAMAAEARWGRRVLWRGSTTYAATVTVAVLLTMLQDTTTAVNKWVWRLGLSVAWWQPWGPHALRYAKWLFEVWSVSSCIVALYSPLYFQLAMHRVCAVLLVECGARFQDFQRRDIGASVATHVTLLRLSRAVNDAFGLLLPFYLMGSATLSLLSTASLVKSGLDADTFAVSCLPYVFIFFVPMCLAGQRVEDASEGLAFAAYSGPWLEEDCRSRRCRLMVIASCARPATFETPGVGPLNRPTCRKGLRSWFQFVQVLLNTTR